MSLWLPVCLAVAAGCAPVPAFPEPTAAPASTISLQTPIASAAPPATPTATPPATATPTLTLTLTATPLPEQSTLPPVDQARADLAAQLGVAPEAIEIVTVLPASSPDVSLGCARYALSDNPPPADALVIELRYQDQVYTYQSAGVERPVQCDSGVGYPPATRERRDNILTPPAQP
jgi:hypothetical protein